MIISYCCLYLDAVFVDINVMLPLSASPRLTEENKVFKEEHPAHHLLPSLEHQELILAQQLPLLLEVHLNAATKGFQFSVCTGHQNYSRVRPVTPHPQKQNKQTRHIHTKIHTHEHKILKASHCSSIQLPTAMSCMVYFSFIILVSTEKLCNSMH